jgi:phosphoserine phosphatase RsbU/P
MDEASTSQPLRNPENAPQRPEPGDGTPGEMNHVVQFYEDDAFLCDTVARFIGAGLAAGESVVIIATDLHRHAFLQRLKANDFDVERATGNGRLTLLDARETLRRIVVDGLPDWERFVEVIGAALPTGGAHVRAYGEMVDLLWRDGNPCGAIRLEEMWNDLGRHHHLSLLCAYVMGNFYKESDAGDFERVCRTHAHVVPAEGYSTLDDVNARMHEIARLQQRAQSLEAEVAHRKSVGDQLARVLLEQTNRRDESEERFRLIIDSVNDYAIFMLDEHGRVATWNPGAERIKGWRAEEIIGEYFSRFYPDEDVRAGKCQYELEHATRDGRFEDEGWRVRKDGTRFWANVIISRVIDKSGKLVGFAKVTRNLEQRRALELERIARAAAEAELAERAKAAMVRERLLGVVGHDLRAPLSAIAMASSVMLKKGTLTDNDHKMVARVARNADRMAKMISQLLDFTRARMGGGIPVDPKPLDFAEVGAEVVGDFQVAHPDRQLAFARGGDTVGTWDRERLAQVVTNLVGNAVQYGRADGVIDVRLHGDAERVRLTVHNDGDPIPPDLLPTIFDPFRRSDEHRDRTESLGLGLFIVQEIVHAHGGTIEVRSDASEGTTFLVTLPRAR